MSIKSKVLAASPARTLVVGGAVGALSAGSGAPSCGHDYIDIFSYELGRYHGPDVGLGVLRKGEKVGQPITIIPVWTSNSDPAKDFTVAFQDLVPDFYAADLVPAAVNLHYGGGATGFPDDPALEIEYAPFGADGSSGRRTDQLR